MLKYSVDTPKRPARKYIYNMGTKLNYFITEDNLTSFDNKKYETEKIKIPDRTGSTYLPVLITYHKDTFTDSSPIVLKTEGYDSERAEIFKF